ncbi:elongation factor P 5-aminopentanone reductase [Gorillibacterium sp. sgz500922]|uniref:elongation factor P 5-aminopentanone reductase n=1 Tax=Gorillibacterium sp. sgz500922 TaxID=3446694 RepID=UPI003F67DA40
MSKAFPEQTVLITGASRGIGAAIAERFATARLNLILHYLQSHEAANEVARRCMELGSRVLTVSCDIRSRDQLRQMKDKIASHGFAPPDILVNNAGVSHYGLLADLTDDEWDRVLDINLRGSFLTTQLFMEEMVRQKYGRIINVSSIWGLTGASCEVAYSAAKGGLNAFTKALAKELAPSGVTVNAVAPGPVDTEMMKGFSDAEKQAIEQEIPAGRFARPDEIASLVYYLSLPESGYITGQIVSASGGWVT